jgi:glycosyltransferase involved in cell wall biosynthesis
LTTSTNPIISIIIPVFNCEQYLEEAIESVVNQNFKPLDVIVVNDGSTDGSLLIAESYLSRIRIFQQLNLGAAEARNTGINNANGEFLAFLDADDIWLLDKLSSQYELFIKHPEIDMVFGGIEQFISPELEQDRDTPTVAIDKHPLGILPGTMLIKKASFLKVGLFDPAWEIGEFIDWYAKAKELKLSKMVLPKTVLRRRIHTSNLGIRAKDSRSDYIQILKASLDRKRKL